MGPGVETEARAEVGVDLDQRKVANPDPEREGRAENDSSQDPGRGPGPARDHKDEGLHTNYLSIEINEISDIYYYYSPFHHYIFSLSSFYLGRCIIWAFHLIN